MKKDQKTRKIDSRLLNDKCNGPKKRIRYIILFDIDALISDFKILMMTFLIYNCSGKSTGIGIACWFKYVFILGNFLK